MWTSGSDLLRLRWEAALQRGENGAPLVDPLFVAEQGPGVNVVDLRPPAEATGVAGYIPGSVFFSAEQVDRSAPRDKPIVLVSHHGTRAAIAAKHLEQRGIEHVAALAGGLAAWRRLGIGTSRDPAGVTHELPASAPASAQPGRLSLEQVRQHLGDPRSVRWVKLTSLVSFARASCVDGRDERGVIGAPGGDAGKLLVALAGIERVTGVAFDDDTVQQLLLRRLDALGDFYMHTDTAAFDRLTDALRRDDQLAGRVGGFDAAAWIDFFQHPEQEHQASLLEYLVDPAHVGCGHLKLMLQHPDEYRVRADLTRSFLRAFFRLWWQGATELEYTVLPGKHAEGAVVNVRLEEPLWRLSRIPLVSPACGATQMFVNHPDVSTFLQDTVAEFYARGAGTAGTPEHLDDLRAVFRELAQRHLEATLDHLAKGLPVYDVEFGVDGAFAVREA